MAPIIIKHSRLKTMLFPFIILCITICLIVAEAAKGGLLISMAFFVFFTTKGILSFNDYIVMNNEEICFYDNRKVQSKIKYADISKLDLYIDTNPKHSITYMCIFKKNLNRYETEIDFSDF